jgi:hypothetical protein
LQTGFEFALAGGAAHVVTCDADGQHRVEDIAALLAPVVAGACDVALGTRFQGAADHIPLGRRWLLRGAVLGTRLVHRLPVTDAHNGLRAFSRRAAECVQIQMDRMAHASELLDIIRRAELRFCEVPVHIRYTDYSLARKRSLGDALRIALHYFIGQVTR